MFNLGFFGSHNSSFAISYKGEILEVVELERLINVKNAALFFWGYHENVIEIITEVKNYFKNKYKVEIYDNVIYNSVDKETYKIFPANNYVHLLHHQAHAYSSLYQSPYDKALIISFDGGSDEGHFNAYIGEKNKDVEKVYTGEIDYAVAYMIPSHFIEDIRQEEIFAGNLIYPGKLMGLSAYGQIDSKYIDTLRNFYLATKDGNIPITRSRFIEAFSKFGITSDSTRLKGEDAHNLAATNQYIFEELFMQEIQPLLSKYSDLPLIITGGCGLNILNNTKLASKREVFITPNPNDTGLAVGLVCSKVRPFAPVDCTYLGSEVWDRNELTSIIHSRKGKLYTIESIVDKLVEGAIIGVVQGRSEHGPRALGNRSIICDASIPNMKNTLNAKVKGREYYRPFAPIVRLEDVSKYFEWEGESRWMTFSPKVRQEYREVLKEITHADGTARVQTITRKQNKLIYDILTEMHNRKGYGVLINTSFNIAGKPILNTYKDALWVLDNKELNGLIFENYYINKNG